MDTLDNTRQIIQETERRICDQRIKRLVSRLLIAAFAWFMLIPENWETQFWPISAPLVWVADAISSIGKIEALLKPTRWSGGGNNNFFQVGA